MTLKSYPLLLRYSMYKITYRRNKKIYFSMVYRRLNNSLNKLFSSTALIGTRKLYTYIHTCYSYRYCAKKFGVAQVAVLYDILPNLFLCGIVIYL